MQLNSFYITTPIYYVNDIPHLGHAYTSVVSDTLARYKKLNNYKVFFSTGTDEHGQKVENSALDKSQDTKSFTDIVSQRFKMLTGTLNLVNNDFIRTTEDRHKEQVTKVWQKLVDKGEIYLGDYEGWYSVRDESFISLSDIITDKDNNKIGPSKDILKKIKEPSYFFKLSKWQKPLLEFYNKHKDFVKPHTRYNEVIKFVERGLDDLSISRTSFEWGIKVPNDPKHIVYVWLDALLNYISVLGGEDSDDYKNFWPADIHVVGKDILRFHAVYWPAFLLAAGYKPPKKVYAHGWWTIDGEKMSKSLGNVIDPNYLVDKYGCDQLRYFLLREIPCGKDGNFSEDLLIKRINSDLSNDYGNLVQRVLSMLQKYFGGKIPDLKVADDNDSNLLLLPELTCKNIKNYMDDLNFTAALDEIWEIIRKANYYVDISEPWTLYKTNNIDRLGTIIYVLLNVIFKIAILTQPFLPMASKKILSLLNKNSLIEFSYINTKLESGITLGKPNAVFPRFIKED